MSTRKKKMFIIKTITFVSLFVVIVFAVFQASNIKPANSTVTNEKKEFLKTFQDVKLIEQELEVNSQNLSDLGTDIDDEEEALLKERGIVEERISEFKRYTAKELLTSGFISTFTTKEEQEAFLALYGDEEYFINSNAKIVVVKNGREIDGVLTYQRPIESDDTATQDNDVYPKFTLSKLDSFKLQVTLKYPEGSVSQQYKTNNEEQWHDYQSPITIEENVTIYTQYKPSADSEYVTGNQKVISDLRLSKPIYSFDKTTDIIDDEEVEIYQIKFEKVDVLDGITFRYYYSLNGSEFSDEIEGESFDITEEGTYNFKVRSVIPDKNINDSVEQEIAFTYIYGEEIYEDVIEKSSNTNISTLVVTTNTNNYVELFSDEIEQLNNGETVTKEVSEDVTQITVKATPEDTASTVVGNITYLISENSELTINLRIVAENGDDKTVTLCIKKSGTTEDLYYASSGSSSGYSSGGGSSSSQSQTSKKTASCIGYMYHITEDGVKESHTFKFVNSKNSDDYHIKECLYCSLYMHEHHYYDLYSNKYTLRLEDGVVNHVHTCLASGCGHEVISPVTYSETDDPTYHLSLCRECYTDTDDLRKYSKQLHSWGEAKTKEGKFYTTCVLGCNHSVSLDKSKADIIRCEIINGHKWYSEGNGSVWKCKNCTLTKNQWNMPDEKYTKYTSPYDFETDETDEMI